MQSAFYRFLETHGNASLHCHANLIRANQARIETHCNASLHLFNILLPTTILSK
ncbi:MAG: hypothetical protein VSS75_026845 [Candidatus Parabeggiatoa sp.]|nr:hypothetical protein [Candidatus Parabeggiatoa sp.]